MGWPNRPGRFREAMVITRDIRKICRQLQAGRFWTDLGWIQSRSVPDGADKTCQRCGTQDLVALSVHSDQPTLRRRDVNAELVIGWCWFLTLACNERALWGTPRKRALFGSDGQNSISSMSDVPEGEYSEVAQSSRSPRNDDRAGTRSPSVKLVDVVLQLQKDMEEFRAESGYGSAGRQATPVQTYGRSGFTSTVSNTRVMIRMSPMMMFYR